MRTFSSRTARTADDSEQVASCAPSQTARPDARCDADGSDNDAIEMPELTLGELAAELERWGITAHASDPTAVVRGMSIDSRTVETGNLFVCKGAAFRPAFLTSAVEAGATAYLCEAASLRDGDANGAEAGSASNESADGLGAAGDVGAAAHRDADPASPGASAQCGAQTPLVPPAELLEAAPQAPYLVVSDVRRAMARVAPPIYGHPEQRLTIIGITGTKGKSTTAYLLRSILQEAGIIPSVLGSIETDDGIQHFESHNTTPEAPDLWRHLYNSVRAGRRVMVMEVSSQGLKYDRVLGLPLTIGCFLNIGRDHISPSEHPTFEDYLASKLRIFDSCETAVVNLGSDELSQVLEASAHAPHRLTVAVETADGATRGSGGGVGERDSTDPASETRAAQTVPAPDYVARQVEDVAGGIRFQVVERSSAGAALQGCAGGESADRGPTDGTPANEAPADRYSAPHELFLDMPGTFNAENALMAIACARALGIGYGAIARALAEVRVPGRMEPVSSPDGRILALVDYAHNELSYETLFRAMRASYPDRAIVAVFGAPGDKALERREALPRVAGAYADLLIYTEEDPAHEAVEDICAELVAHTPKGVAHEVVLDREDAIRRAITWARAQERPAVVLLLGKGDETRQHRGDAYPEVKSDLAIARELLETA